MEIEPVGGWITCRFIQYCSSSDPEGDYFVCRCLAPLCEGPDSKRSESPFCTKHANETESIIALQNLGIPLKPEQSNIISKYQTPTGLRCTLLDHPNDIIIARANNIEDSVRNQEGHITCFTPEGKKISVDVHDSRIPQHVRAEYEKDLRRGADLHCESVGIPVSRVLRPRIVISL